MTLRHVNGRVYRYKSVREGDRVRSVYQGGGEFAALSAAFDRFEANHRRSLLVAERLREADRCRKARRLQARVGRYDLIVEALWRAEMEERGFHQHARSAWRRKRMGTSLAKKGSAAVPAEPDPMPWEDAVALVRRAGEGDKEALASLRAVLRGRSQLRRDLIAWTGDLGTLLVNVMLNGLPGLEEDPALHELVRSGLAEIRRELAPPGTPPLERLLVQRIEFAWLEAHAADLSATSLTADSGLRRVEAVLRRADRANRRLLASMKALASIRRTGPNTLVQIVNKGKVRVG